MGCARANVAAEEAAEEVVEARVSGIKCQLIR